MKSGIPLWSRSLRGPALEGFDTLLQTMPPLPIVGGDDRIESGELFFQLGDLT